GWILQRADRIGERRELMQLGAMRSKMVGKIVAGHVDRQNPVRSIRRPEERRTHVGHSTRVRRPAVERLSAPGILANGSRVCQGTTPISTHEERVNDGSDLVATLMTASKLVFGGCHLERFISVSR